MAMMNNPPKTQPVIELSTVYFYEGQIPRSIALKDCGLAMRAPVPGALTALYGYQSKQEGFMAARAFADQRRLQFTVIDFLVRLDHPINPGLMKPSELAQHDFISFLRMSRGMLNDLQAILEEHGGDDAGDEAAKPHLLVMRRPELLVDVIHHPDLRHFKVIAHPAKPVFSERPLTVGTVPFAHWDAIQEASCRLNPTTRVTLERPGVGDQPKPSSPAAPEPAPAINHRPAPPRNR